MKFAIIDESGRLYDPNDRVLVFTAVLVNSLVNLDKIIPTARKHLPRKTTLAEIKFSTTGDKTKTRVLRALSKKDLTIFVLIINKEGRKIIDNPDNYSLLVANLLNKINSKYSTVDHVIIDKHFS